MNDRDAEVIDALRRLAGRDAATVLEEAVEQGRAEATRILQQRYVDLLLEEVADPGRLCRAEPQPAEAGWYVYAITSPGQSDHICGMSGVQGSKTEVIVERDLAAIASRITGRRHDWGIDQDGQMAPELLAPLAHAHELVLEALMEQSTALPMRFGILYPSEAAIKAVLARNAGTIAEALAKLQDKVEWGLTVYQDPDTKGPGPEALPKAQDGSGEPGRNYLGERRAALARKESLAESRAHLAAELHAGLASVVADSVIHPVPRRQAGTRNDSGGDTILKASYLVAKQGANDFRQAIVAGLSAQAEFGLRGDLTGPWPPYNFSDVELVGSSS